MVSLGRVSYLYHRAVCIQSAHFSPTLFCTLAPLKPRFTEVYAKQLILPLLGERIITFLDLHRYENLPHLRQLHPPDRLRLLRPLHHHQWRRLRSGHF